MAHANDSADASNVALCQTCEVPPKTVLVAHPGAELYGSDRVLLDSVLGMIDAGNRVVVALPAAGPLVNELTAAGAEVVTAPSFVVRKRLLRPSGWGELVRTGWSGTYASWRILRKVRPDVVYVSTITLPLWPLLGRLHGVAVALHVHEGEASAGRLTKAVLYAPAFAAQRILVNSTFSRNVMVSTYRQLAQRSVIVLNAVPGPADPVAPRQALDGGLRVLFIGRLSPRKGADVAIGAISIMHQQGIDASLDIVGSTFPGYEEYEASLREAIVAAGLQERVVMHGFHRDVWGFLESSDVLVVPSRIDEPFGNTAVEGILAARPVITSDTSGLREATQGISSASRVPPDSAAALADELARVSTRWAELRSEVYPSRSVALDRHSPVEYQRRVASLLDELKPLR